jgi:hypothetical protein
MSIDILSVCLSVCLFRHILNCFLYIEGICFLFFSSFELPGIQKGEANQGARCRHKAASEKAAGGLHRCVKQLGVGPPRRAARRGPATWYTSTSTVPPGIMHDGIVRRGPARRHALRRLHRGVKQLGVGPPRGVQLGVVGLHRGVKSKKAAGGLHRCVKQLGVGPPRRAARRGPATWYTSCAAVPPGDTLCGGFMFSTDEYTSQEKQTRELVAGTKRRLKRQLADYTVA